MDRLLLDTFYAKEYMSKDIFMQWLKSPDLSQTKDKPFKRIQSSMDKTYIFYIGNVITEISIGDFFTWLHQIEIES